MTLGIIEAITDGINRTLTRNGLVLVAVFVLLAVVNGLLAPASTDPATDPGSVVVLRSVLSLVVSIATVVAVIVALRTFVSGETESIPGEFVRRNIGLATLNVIVGGLVFVISVAVGTLLFVIPGLFVLVSLYFWTVFVAVEDRNFVGAFRSSWGLTSGSRLRLFGLGAIVVSLGLIANTVAAIPLLVIGGIGGTLLVQVVTALVTVYTLATTAAAYDQLVGRRTPPEGEPHSEPAEAPA